MDKLFDRISRILATPMSRSQAFKLIVGGVTGAVLAPFAFAQDPRCPEDRVFCAGFPGGGANEGCCPVGQQCCPGTNPPSSGFCCSHVHTCCGNVCCVPPKICDQGVCRTRTPSDPQP